jgi:hypothetical protein
MIIRLCHMYTYGMYDEALLTLYNIHDLFWLNNKGALNG